MGFSKTPYEMQREQQERAIKAQEQAYGRQAAMQAWSALADMDTVTPEAPLAPTHDWQHSADTAAKHAAAMELQTLEGKQKREQIADKAAQDRASTMYEYKVKAAFRPKPTGGGYPNEKLEKQIWDVRKTVPADATQQALNDRHVSFLLDKMRAQGPGGRKRADQIASAIRNESPEMQSPEGWNKRTNTENLVRMKNEAMTAAEGIKAKNKEEQMRLDADKALLRTFEPGLGKVLSPEDEMAFKDATKRVMSRAQGQQTSTGRASAPAADLPAKTPAAQPSSQMEIRIINGVKYLRDPATGKIYQG